MHSKSRARWQGWRAKPLIGALVAVAAVVMAFTASAFAAGVGHYDKQKLVSDRAGAELMDPNLVNAWGLAFGPAGPHATPAWVANNGSDNSTLYAGAVNGSPVTAFPPMNPLVVSIPGGEPTGMVFNGSAKKFAVNGGPALFIFDSEAGKITAWNGSLGTQAKTVANVHKAIFKGLAILGNRLYATDFHNNRVDVWNGSFQRVKKPGAFTDPKLPPKYAPFGIDVVKGNIVVTYARQDKNAEDDVAGRGHGFVDVYNPNGKLLRRLVSHGALNSPWGVTLAPSGFGAASGKLLVGNFGNGKINVYKWANGQSVGPLRGPGSNPVQIDGLWALEFGNGVIGTPRTLLFTAGPADESHGLFGALTKAH
jgi:uncharacterized protein (TIGR03118 family)